MNEEPNRGREVFREEAYELLAELENSLLELEMAPDNKDMMERAFRAMHTLKGSSSMFGFDAIANLTHEAETVYDLVRKGKMKVAKELMDLTFRITDQIRTILGEKDDSGLKDNSAADDIIRSFQAFLSNAGLGVSHPPAGSEIQAKRESPISLECSQKDSGTEVSGKKVTYRIHFRPYQDIFLKGFNPLPMLNEISKLGRCTLIAHADSIPDLEHIDPEMCYTCWDVILTTSEGINPIKDAFIFIEDNCELSITSLDKSGSFDSEEAHKQLRNIILEKGDLTEDIAKDLIAKRQIINTPKSAVKEIHLTDNTQQETGSAKGNQLEVSSIRVAAHKLDKLVNLVGELVTVQARLSQSATFSDDPEMLLIAEEIERLTDELRDSTMNIRLVPIVTIFNRFRRLVRDLSNELGKEVEFITEGGETELDKNVIEKLNDPLIHIIRNSIDHGIEHPDIRMNNAKKRTGILHLAAEYSGASVLIRIRDDGAGLDLQKIRRDAVENGLIKEESQLTERDIFSIIFSPGFSTSEEVTKVSGRGVGLDVVKRSIDALRGTVDIDSKRGTGTTITLKIPLTLAIIEGLLLKVGNNQYIVPLSAVEECIELRRGDMTNAYERHMIQVRGKIIPYIRLREFFYTDGNPPDIEQIVITEVNGKRIGLAVDHVIGEHQTVIKSLGRFYRDIDLVSGATILGDGKVAIILNIPKIIEYTESEEMNRFAGHV